MKRPLSSTQSMGSVTVILSPPQSYGPWLGGQRWPYLVCIGEEEDGDGGLQKEHQQQHHKELGIGGTASATRPSLQPHLPRNLQVLSVSLDLCSIGLRPASGHVCPMPGSPWWADSRTDALGAGVGQTAVVPRGSRGGHCQHRQDQGGGTATRSGSPTSDCTHAAWPAPPLSATEAPPWPGPWHSGPS